MITVYEISLMKFLGLEYDFLDLLESTNVP